MLGWRGIKFIQLRNNQFLKTLSLSLSLFLSLSLNNHNFAQMCFLSWTVSHVSYMAHGPLVKLKFGTLIVRKDKRISYIHFTSHCPKSILIIVFISNAVCYYTLVWQKSTFMQWVLFEGKLSLPISSSLNQMSNSNLLNCWFSFKTQ